jgi:hypothetical protein
MIKKNETNESIRLNYGSCKKYGMGGITGSNACRKGNCKKVTSCNGTINREQVHKN